MLCRRSTRSTSYSHGHGRGRNLFLTSARCLVNSTSFQSSAAAAGAGGGDTRPNGNGARDDTITCHHGSYSSCITSRDWNNTSTVIGGTMGMRMDSHRIIGGCHRLELDDIIWKPASLYTLCHGKMHPYEKSHRYFSTGTETASTNTCPGSGSTPSPTTTMANSNSNGKVSSGEQMVAKSSGNKEATATNEGTNAPTETTNELELELETEEMERLLATTFLQAREISALAMSMSISSAQPTASTSHIHTVPIPSNSFGRKKKSFGRRRRRNRTRSSSIMSPKSSPPPPPPSSTNSVNSQSIQQAVQAAQALITLTSHPSFRRALRHHQTMQQQQPPPPPQFQQQPQHSQPQTRSDPLASNVNDASVSLHWAFLSVTSWLCSLLSSSTTHHTIPNHHNHNQKHKPPHFLQTSNMHNEQTILLSHILNLTIQSTDLNLPLHLPLYQTIATLIARHDSGNDTALIILDLSTQVRNLLSPKSSGATPTSTSNVTSASTCTPSIVPPSFFAQPLKELLYRNRIRHAVEVLHGMASLHHPSRHRHHSPVPTLTETETQREEYGEYALDTQTGMELLAILKDCVERAVNQKTRNDNHLENGEDYEEWNDEDAMELTLLLQRPLLEQIRKRNLDWRGGESIGTRRSKSGPGDADEEDGLVNQLNDTIGVLLEKEALEDDEVKDDLEDDYGSLEELEGNGRDRFALDCLDGGTDDDDNPDEEDGVQQSVVDDDDDDDDDDDGNHVDSIAMQMEQLNAMIKSITNGEGDESTKQAARDIATSILQDIRRGSRSLLPHPSSNLSTPPSDAAVTKEGDSKDESEPWKKSLEPGAVTARFHVDPTTGAIQNIDFAIDPTALFQQQQEQQRQQRRSSDVDSKDTSLQKQERKSFDDLHDEMLKDMIYMRNSNWELPDIIPQLQKWNGGEKLLFTKEYEDDIAREIMEEDSSYNDHDDDGFSEYHIHDDDDDDEDDGSDDDDDDDFDEKY